MSCTRLFRVREYMQPYQRTLASISERMHNVRMPHRSVCLEMLSGKQISQPRNGLEAVQLSLNPKHRTRRRDHEEHPQEYIRLKSVKACNRTRRKQTVKHQFGADLKHMITLVDLQQSIPNASLMETMSTHVARELSRAQPCIKKQPYRKRTLVGETSPSQVEKTPAERRPIAASCGRRFASTPSAPTSCF